MTHEPAELLLPLARRGDAAATGTLLEAYRPYLTLLARVHVGRKLQGKIDPADVVQETFLDAHRQLAQFRGSTEAEFTAWLRRILAGQVALQVRRFVGTQGRDVGLERSLAAEIDASSQVMDLGLFNNPHSTPSQHASRREQAVLLADALARLPEELREVLVLRHLEELTFHQVAERMGRNPNGIHKVWVRALGALRDAMGGES